MPFLQTMPLQPGWQFRAPWPDGFKVPPLFEGAPLRALLLPPHLLGPWPSPRVVDTVGALQPAPGDSSRVLSPGRPPHHDPCACFPSKVVPARVGVHSPRSRAPGPAAGTQAGAAASRSAGEARVGAGGAEQAPPRSDPRAQSAVLRAGERGRVPRSRCP